MYAEEEAALILAAGAGDAGTIASLARRRADGEPLEHILGWAAFCGMRIRVGPGVFVPRARTAVVVRQAAELLGAGDRVVDLCCGSGAIGAALVRAVGPLDLVATDVDPVAVALAAENIGDGGTAVCGDLFEALPSRLRGTVDVIAVNAPYVPTAEIARMPAEAREGEPRVALDGGDDGLGLHRRIAAAAPAWLRTGGSVVIEAAERQTDASSAMFADAGMRVRTVVDDEVDGACVVATLPDS